MTRPTDASIARAFWAERERFLVPGHGEPVTHGVLLKIEIAAYGFDAESPAGTSLADMFTINESPCLPDGVVVFSQGGEVKGVMHTTPEKVTTSRERVQIPAESEHVAPYDRCPKCTAHMPVGQTCGGVNCGLKTKETPDV